MSTVKCKKNNLDPNSEDMESVINKEVMTCQNVFESYLVNPAENSNKVNETETRNDVFENCPDESTGYVVLENCPDESNVKKCQDEFENFCSTNYIPVEEANSDENVCDICNNKYSNKHSMQTHKRIEHVDIKEKTCTFCGIIFATFYTYIFLVRLSYL